MVGDKDMNNTYEFPIYPDDFVSAGEASSAVRKMLKDMGIKPDIIKKVAISMYEAEINAVIHGNGGYAVAQITDDYIIVSIKDGGPGIEDIDLAMKAGYTTASDSVREMGFGAGMGLPNIKRYADKMTIRTKIGVGTEIIIENSLK